MLRFLILAAALVVTWLVWSGLYKGLLLALGLFSVALVLWLCVRMGLFRRAVYALDLVPKLLGYWVRLLIDVVKSNFVVARIILSPSLPISPTMIELAPKLEGQVGLATMANSITLTPSTVTLDVHDQILKVHCLTEASARAQLASDIDVQLARALGDR
ncbi:MAG: Na+/H+ antiporter subunit E [Xanthomonadales bacterium]|jgi:multicomponent Na+:H+ antiporter subunit E|nr:Na+/H+ antiporter subunit E [Xanthomonadales bacterium]